MYSIELHAYMIFTFEYLVINSSPFSDHYCLYWYICEIINNILTINYFKSAKIYVKKLSTIYLTVNICKICIKIFCEKNYIWNRKREMVKKIYIWSRLFLFLSSGIKVANVKYLVGHLKIITSIILCII